MSVTITSDTKEADWELSIQIILHLELLTMSDSYMPKSNTTSKLFSFFFHSKDSKDFSKTGFCLKIIAFLIHKKM